MRNLMKIITIALLVFGIEACTKDQPTPPLNEEERILTVSYRYRHQAWAGGYSDTKLIFDSTYTTFQKRLGYDTNYKLLPNIDTTFNISSQMWLKIKSSFNMDSIMMPDSLYESLHGEESEKTIEIFTSQLHKKIIFFTSNQLSSITKSRLQCLDSLDKILNKL